MPAPAPDLPTEPIDLRLVVTDLDGTLLDGEGRVPERLWDLLPLLRERGVVLAPASGRQYPALRRLFAGNTEGMAFIAENGTFVVLDGAELSCTPVDPGFARELVRIVRELRSAGHRLGLVWCGRGTAYVEWDDPEFVAQVATYYASLEVVDDLRDAPEPAIKFAVYDFGDPDSGSTRILTERCAPHQVVPSSAHWVDIMSPAVNKGAALSALQRTLGISPDQTVVFGDYLNDPEMITDAPYSFAMANAHPDVLEAARFVAPRNTEQGVVRVLEHLLEASAPAA
ncbi:MAG: Cof-type HAD-IIB family hydrolase [Propionicimonas sp.]|uniref:Cof-type HAD-IIB family hydrolase n=1 Tax=Propionicimonas sp. TaxID=1955623 RepID=UPI003D10E5F2